MGIDIDGFLEEFEQVEQENTSKKKEKTKSEKKDKKIDLTFDKYVNDKFDKLQENVDEEDFKFLIKAYSEIKKFDQNLPKKLLELKKTSGTALSSLGKKYTINFLEGIKQNKNKHGLSVSNQLSNIETLIKNKQIPKAINLYNQITTEYKLFPKEYIIEKIELGKKLRDIEIKLNNEFTIFWDIETKKIRKQLSSEISNLKHNLVPGRIEQIEANLHNINTTMENAPSIFYNELVKERIQVAKIIIVAEEFLKTQYIEEFKEKEQQFKQLFERFHKYQIKKDVESALTCYDEMLYIFEKMPDAFIEKKIEIYKQIDKSFESLNNLLLTNSVSQFMETYNSSKILSQAREYLNHAKKNSEFDTANLISIKNDLNKIPHKLQPEKVELENEILKLIHQKTINEIKQYLDNGYKNKDFEIKKLKSYQEKISQISDLLVDEKTEISSKVDELVNKFTKISQEKKKLELIHKKEKDELKLKELEVLRDNNQKTANITINYNSDDNSNKQNTTKNKEELDLNKTKTFNVHYNDSKNQTQQKPNTENKLNSNPKIPKMPTQTTQDQSKQISIEPLIVKSRLDQKKLNNVNISMIDEINENFQLIQHSSNLAEKERLTKKINFYISLIPLNPAQKETITNKLEGN
mgnify:CR=1 FL=1